MKIIKKSYGFTLIESLVVITMMMVITAVAVTSYSTASKKNRDNRRKADLEKIRTSLEMFRQSDLGGSYPSDASTELVSGGFIDAWPADPKDTQNYSYSRTTDYTYTLDALLEIATGDSYGNNCGGVCNYRVSNP